MTKGTPLRSGFETDVNDENPVFKIKLIRTLKEWAIYWKYYIQNNDCRV